MRSSHTKSRNGCRECKQRHRKCDESVPICLNCAMAKRPCSYRFSRPTYRLCQSSRPATPSMSGPATPAMTPIGTAPTTPESTGLEIPEWQPQIFRYSMGDLQLLHHLNLHILMGEGVLLLPAPTCNMIMQHALSTPYLMDQMLALSAAHMSTVRQDNADHRELYRKQATILQTRALALVNRTGVGISAQNGCSWFLYSSLLGLHVMFETFQCTEFGSFLGQLSTYLSVHRGVHIVIRQSWESIKDIIDQIMAHCSCSYLGRLTIEDGQPRECGVLTTLINQANFGEAERKACHQAVERLQWLFDLYRAKAGASTQVHFTIAWPITMPARFADMLGKQQPVTLVIFAFYAVLLHRSRSFWIFGSSGRFLIESIAGHLGPIWERWLIYPRRQLEITPTK